MKPSLPVIHHLPRTGGTLISRCIGAFSGIALLSEINPGGVARIDPVSQAGQWYGYQPPSEPQQTNGHSTTPFSSTIAQISAFLRSSGQQLLIRDWSHIDFIGFPFNDDPAMSLCLRNQLESEFSVSSVASVRHPLDQFASMRKLRILEKDWNDVRVLRGMRVFAEQIQDLTWIRFEDFVENPNRELGKLCQAWEIDFDPTFHERWTENPYVTGDAGATKHSQIKPIQRHPMPAEIYESLNQEDFFITCELLGYTVPDEMHSRTTSVQLGRRATLDELHAEGTQRIQSKEFAPAAERYREILARSPNDDRAGNHLGFCLLRLDQVEEAVDVLRAHLDRYPDTIVAIRNLISGYVRLDRKFDAIPWQRRLIRLCPNEFNAMFSLGTSLTRIGAVDEGQALCKAVMLNDVENRGAAANYLMFLNYQHGLSANEISKEHFRIATRFSERSESLPRRALRSGEKIRVGYVSADFRVHPVGKIIKGIIDAHNTERFEVYVYSDEQRSDDLTKSVQKAVAVYHNVSSMSDDTLLARIRDDKVDVLIDLGGYTGGGNRTSVFARRGAPVQVSFLGYPNTSALHTIDYRLTDRFADPPGLTEGLYSERLIWLDQGFLAWEPYEVARAIEPTATGRARIGAFNNVAKISPEAIKAWAQILRRCPDVEFVLKYGDRYEVALVKDRMCRQFTELGVLPERLHFMPVSPRIKDHLSVLSSVDLALDSFPYQGTMTSLECLSVGTPILSLIGSYYAHRATSAMMMRLDLNELIAGDVNEYVEIATQLLSDVDGLRSLREVVRERFYRSALVQPRAITEDLERWMSGLFDKADDAGM